MKATPIHASDLHVLRGRYGFFPEFPAVGGHMECVGRIEALSPDTEGLKIGERVVAVAVPAVSGPHVAGTWQEYLVADTRRLRPVPDHLSDSSAGQLAVNPRGLATCVQVSIAGYPDIVREQLKIPEELTILCGLAIGYADMDFAANNLRVGRDASASTSFHRRIAPQAFAGTCAAGEPREASN